jgi:Relaxase/Mobilisation nuclease domain
MLRSVARWLTFTRCATPCSGHWGTPNDRLAVIIIGKSRAAAGSLGNYLSTEGENERIQVLEVKGTVAQDVRGAILEMDAYAMGTRCEKPLYHAMINPEPPHTLTPEQRTEAVNALEEKLGLTGHARVVVLHDKKDREHLHVVWSRIDLDHMRSVSDSHNYRKHEEVARDLERRFGHDRVQGAHIERDGIDRPDRTPSRPELRQEERTGITGKQVKADVTEAYRSSDGAEAFRAALEDRGYLLAQGDRRDFVVLDIEGGVHSLARRIAGVKAAELREFMKPIDRESLPDVEQAKDIVFAREHGWVSARDQQEWDNALAIEAIQKDRQRQDDERRRTQEAREDRFNNRIEAAYGRGDGYVAQSTAAQKDHKRRQKSLDANSEERMRRLLGGVDDDRDIDRGRNDIGGRHR